MNDALARLRHALDGRKWILWLAIVLLLVTAWFVLVSLLPHHVVDTIKHYEEQPNGVREVQAPVHEAR